MHRSNSRFAAIALFAGLATAGVVGVALADEFAKEGAPIPQKEISQPFLDNLVGTWNTEATGIHDGKETKGTGKVTFTRGIGDTAILQTYELKGTGPDGKEMVFHGHGVTKLSDDGKTATTWWFCNMSPDVQKVTGPVTADSLTLRGESSITGAPVTITMKKTADGVVFEITEGANKMTDKYTRAR